MTTGRSVRQALGAAIGVLTGVAILLGGCAAPGRDPGPAGGTPTVSTPTAPASGTGSSAPGAPSTPGGPAAPPAEPGGEPTDGVHGRPPVTGQLAMPPADRAGPEVTVHGTVTQADTMPDCLIFRTDAGQQFQFTGPAAGAVGHPATPTAVLVTGHIAPNTISYCMLGRGFVADRVSRR